MKIRMIFGTRHDGEVVALECASGEDITAGWFKAEIAKWNIPDRDFSGFVVADVEVDEARIRELCAVPVLPGRVAEAEKPHDPFAKFRGIDPERPGPDDPPPDPHDPGFPNSPAGGDR